MTITNSGRYAGKSRITASLRVGAAKTYGRVASIGVVIADTPFSSNVSTLNQ